MFTGGPYKIEGNQLTSLGHAQPGTRVVAIVERPEDRKLLAEAPDMFRLLKEVLEDDGDGDTDAECGCPLCTCETGGGISDSLRDEIRIALERASGLRAR